MALTLRVEKKYLNELAGVNDLAEKLKWSDIGVRPPNASSQEFLDVISMPLVDIQRYGKTVAWLLDLAKSIFGKEISTGNYGNYGELWIDPGKGQIVQKPPIETDLVAAVYVYRPQPQGPFFIVGRSGFSLSRYWAGPQPVLKQSGQRNQAYFASKVKQREADHCLISHVDESLVASHLIPNRLPHGAILMILQRHSPEGTVLPTTGWGCSLAGVENANNDERIAILVFALLDTMIDDFTLGFYCPDPVNNPDTYTLHSFGDADAGYNVLGIKKAVYANIPGAGNHTLADLHGHQVTFRSRTVTGGPIQVTLERPLHAALSWHYMQCALRKLATQAYRGLPVW